MNPNFLGHQHHELNVFIREILRFAKEEQPLTYTVAQAAEKLQISKSKMYELAQREGFPSVKIDGRVMIPRKKLEEWLSEQAD